MSRPSVEFAASHLKVIDYIAEIGVQSGQHALDMYQRFTPMMMWLVDAYVTVAASGPESKWTHAHHMTWREQAQELLKGTRHVFVLKFSRIASLEVPDGLDFVYIDASHDEFSVTIDVACYFPKVRVGGIIAGHDYGNNNPVQRAVDRLFGSKVQSADVDWWVVKERESYD